MRIIKGDATSPQAKGPKIIAHVCNDTGGWGKGSSWPSRAVGRSLSATTAAGTGNAPATTSVWARSGWSRSGPTIWVANMVAQHGLRSGSSGPPIRYDAVERCLDTVAEHAIRLGASVHMPRIGCGLAGGRWERIEPIILRTLGARGIATTVYDFD